MAFLSGLRMLFGMMLMFGAFYLMRGGEKGEYTRLSEYTLFGVGMVGSLVMWGFGLGKLPASGTAAGQCSECGVRPPMFRKPANRRQMLWGGWTCAGCGAELDRSGKKVADKGE